MATKEQYDVFKFLYDEESARETALMEHSKLYLSLTTLYSAFLIYIAKEAAPQNVTQWAMFGVSATSLAAAFLFSIFAARMEDYEAINDPEKIIESFDEDRPDNESFFDDRIVDLAVACNKNSKVNDKKARRLEFAGICLLVGIAAHAVYFLWRTWP
jgi:hypothetical protein